MNPFDVFFIPRCLSCSDFAGHGGLFCDECASVLNCVSPHKSRRNIPYVDKAFYLWKYNSRMRPPFLSFKFRGFLPVANAFGRIMLRYLEFYKLDISDFFLTYVPMHWARRMLRGYNQSEILAGEMAKEGGLRFGRLLDVKALRLPQHWIKDKSRRKNNVKNIFEARPLPGKMDVLLIDDVVTSGHTVSECARALKKNGAGRVWVLALLG